MSRKTPLTIGLVLTATTIALLTYAAKQVTDLFSFDRQPSAATVDSSAETPTRSQFGEVTLSWDTVPTANAYNLYWSTRPGVTRFSGNKIAGVSPPYRFDAVKKESTYYFVVTAVTAAGESGESEEIVYRAAP